MPLEIACFNPTSAIHAGTNNADRIELCANPLVGGTTPSLSDFNSVKEYPFAKPIPINIMIRPRGGDFVYTDHEFETMSREVTLFDEHGADGFVFGLLKGGVAGEQNEESKSRLEIDVDRCKILLSQAAASAKPCTFHRAFDALSPSSMLAQLEVLISLGYTAVLTSGGGRNSVEGKEMLKLLVERAAGRIEIIVGGGVRSSNLAGLKRDVGASWWHSSAITDTEGGEIASEEEIVALSRGLRS